MEFDGIRIDLRFESIQDEDYLADLCEILKEAIIEVIREERKPIKPIDAFLFKQI